MVAKCQALQRILSRVKYVSAKFLFLPRFCDSAHKIDGYNFLTPINMPGPTNTLLIEGSFEELADELAHYIDEVQKRQNPDNANIQAEITPLLEKGQKDETLKKLVTASDVLNTAPEKGGSPA